MKSFIKALKIIGNVILWLFVIFAVFVTILVFTAQNNKDGLPNIGGKSLINIVSDSMNPTFKRGDLIISQALTNDEKTQCNVGDIITFYSDLNGDGNDDINTHRIVDVYEEDGIKYYITKGDNAATNPVNDSPVIFSKVLGKYTGTNLASVGKIIGFLQTSTGFMCVIVVPLIIFFLFELYNFITVVVTTKNKGKLSKEDEDEIKRRAVEEYLKEQEKDKKD